MGNLSDKEFNDAYLASFKKHYDDLECHGELECRQEYVKKVKDLIEQYRLILSVPTPYVLEWVDPYNVQSWCDYAVAFIGLFNFYIPSLVGTREDVDKRQEYVKKIHKLACQYGSHTFMNDHCGRVIHDFCEGCNKYIWQLGWWRVKDPEWKWVNLLEGNALDEFNAIYEAAMRAATHDGENSCQDKKDVEQIFVIDKMEALYAKTRDSVL